MANLHRRTSMRNLLACAVLCLACVAARADDVMIDALIKQLKNTDSDMRREAAKKLGELGADAKTAGPALIAAAKTDKDLFVRRFAAQALGEVGADPKLAVPVLSGLLKEAVKDAVSALKEATTGKGNKKDKGFSEAVKQAIRKIEKG